MNIDLTALDLMIQNRDLLGFKQPAEGCGIGLCNCFIEHLLAKVIHGYEPALVYHPAYRNIIHTDPETGKTPGNLSDRLFNLPYACMPMPTSDWHSWHHYGCLSDLSGILNSYYDDSCFFEEVEDKIRELCSKDSELCEETVFPKAVTAIRTDYGYSMEEIEDELLDDETYERYLSYKSIHSILWDESTVTDGELSDAFLENIPDQIRELFQENAPFLCSAYIILVFSLLYASGDSVYDGHLSIYLHYDDSITELETLRKAGKLNHIGKDILEAYNKALELMARPTYCFGECQHLQKALDNLNSLAPKGTFFLLEGRLDSYSIQQELYPNPAFQIGAILAGSLAEEILSELN